MELKEGISNALRQQGIETLNSMQQEAGDSILQFEETLLLAPTGSGKTLAYLLPIAQLLEEETGSIQCLIIVPTRELALQVEQVWKSLKTGLKVTTCYGGHDFQVEKASLSTPPAILIGTPGRICDHLNRRTFRLASVQSVVLDEFDKTLQMGFQEEVEQIFRSVGKRQKLVLISATRMETLPEFVVVKDLQRIDYLKDAVHKGELALKSIVIHRDFRKEDAICDLLDRIGNEHVLVFCNQRQFVEDLYAFLQKEGYQVGKFHGDLEQSVREKELVRFRNKSVKILIATDLAARGLDIPEVKHVIHYDLPSRKDEFVHRNGRTARMDEDGSAYIFVRDLEEYATLWDMPVTPYEFTKVEPQEKATDIEWITLYVGAGKRQKISKGDIVGYFCQKGGLDKTGIGLIDIKDNVSFVAVDASAVNSLLKKIDGEKIKGKKIRVAVAN